MKKEFKGFVVGVVLTSLVVSALPTMAEKISKTAELYFNDIKVVIDGKRADLRDANGNVVEPFTIDGTTYLPVRAVSNALNKAVSWDGATQTVYLGANEEIEQPSVWLKDLETFTGTVETKSIDDVAFGGSEYNNILTSNTGDVYQNYLYPKDNNISYLLNSKYSSFKGVFYLNNSSKNDSQLYRVLIYGDDKLLYTSDKVSGGDKPIILNVDVSNVSVLKIVYQSKYHESDWFTDFDGHYTDGVRRMSHTPIGNAGLYE